MTAATCESCGRAGCRRAEMVRAGDACLLDSWLAACGECARATETRRIAACTALDERPALLARAEEAERKLAEYTNEDATWSADVTAHLECHYDDITGRDAIEAAGDEITRWRSKVAGVPDGADVDAMIDEAGRALATWRRVAPLIEAVRVAVSDEAIADEHSPWLIGKARKSREEAVRALLAATAETP